MDINQLQYVVGKVEKDAPAIIRFFGTVCCESAQRFNEEFLFLQDVIQPSKIVVLINSEGGSVIHGMSTFSIIQSCPIEVDCVIEGIAASMASVIWSAGNNLYMHDYSILMIHNPFVYDKDYVDESTENMLNAFRKQLETVYRKRFGLTKDEVRKIMDGEGDADGTYFNAKEAVDAGIIPADHVLKTPKQVSDKVKSGIEGVTDAVSLRDIMASAMSDEDENKLLKTVLAIHKKNESDLQIKTQSMEKNEFLGAIVAQLGFTVDTPVASVVNRVNDLLKAESSLKELQGQYDELKVNCAAKEAEVVNLRTELGEVRASLQTYKEAEQAALTAKIEQTVQDAIDACKIEASAKQNWIDMATKNFETVKAALDSIKGRDKITEQIANDPENVNHVQSELKTAEEKIAEKVKAVVGEVELKKF